MKRVTVSVKAGKEIREFPEVTEGELLKFFTSKGYAKKMRRA